MSEERYISGSRKIDGKYVCKVCHKPCPKRRTRYCSDECFYRNTPSIMRNEVGRRDKGVCAMCGLDTKTLPKRHPYGTPYWEADHIIPVSEGGGLCGLDGYRTLCRGAGTNNCHAKVTGELRKRLNERKRLAKVQKETGRLF